MTGVSIRSPFDITPLFTKWYNKRQEHFFVVTLNGAHEVIKNHLVTVGLLNKTIIHPREAFWFAIKDNAATVVFAHNHPSGLLNPSPEDEEITDRLCMAGSIIGIYVLDHIIFGRSGSFYSFRQHGKIKEDFDDRELAQLAADYKGGI